MAKSKPKKTLYVILAALLVFVIIVVGVSLSYPQQIISNKIAIIRISGTISSQDTIIPTSQVQPSSIIGLLDKAENDPSIKAIVLEINSPGGSAVASDEIAAKVKSINKTTVAWIGDMGTSGAYWIASSADKVVAHPLSLTCNIGAYTLVGDWSVFLNKVGLNYTAIKSGPYKDIGSPYRPLTKNEQQILQNMINQVQDQFVTEVAQNRGLSKEAVEKIADGRPCLGKDALNYGLVDQLGTEDDAIALAQNLSGLKKRKTVTLTEEKGNLLSNILGKTMDGAFYSLGIGLGQELKGSTSLPPLNS